MTTQPETVVIYHGGCPDGVAAAWVAREALMRADLVAASHGDPPPDVVGRDVYLVDFSYRRDVMLGLVESARSVTILDHHQTALTELADLLETGVIAGEIDMNRSGCVITWQHFFGTTPPELLLHIQDRDLWRFELPATRNITAAISSYPLTVDEMDRHVYGDRTLVGLEREGRAINRHRDQLIASTIRTAAEVEIAGHLVLAANCPYAIGSDVADVLCGVGRPFGAYWYVDAGVEKWGLRSRGPDAIDVAAIAESFGGGGHRNASGFRVEQRTGYHGRHRVLSPTPAVV